MIKAVNIDYDWDIFLKANYDIADYSCIVYQQSDNPAFYNTLGGMPSRYTKFNTAIHQLWWDNKSMLKELGELLNIDVKSISTIEQPPGQTIPIHRDHFHQIRTKYPNDTRTRVRANIFLEDWMFGHILQYESKGEWFCPTHWKQGEGFLWDDKISHLSGNSGFQSKYTLQVSGFLKDDNH